MGQPAPNQLGFEARAAWRLELGASAPENGVDGDDSGTAALVRSKAPGTCEGPGLRRGAHRLRQQGERDSGGVLRRIAEPAAVALDAFECARPTLPGGHFIAGRFESEPEDVEPRHHVRHGGGRKTP